MNDFEVLSHVITLFGDMMIDVFDLIHDYRNCVER